MSKEMGIIQLATSERATGVSNPVIIRILCFGMTLAWCMFGLACGGPDTSNPLAEKPKQPSEDALQIETMLVTGSSEPGSLDLPGRATYAEDWVSKVSSPLQGRVLDVRVKLGQAVKVGEVLLVVDTPEIATAYSDYVKEISELGLAKRNYELARDLYQVKALPLKELKQAENDLHREQAEFRQAKEKLLSLKVPAAELDKPLTQQSIISRFELKSPLTGTVVERNVTPGQLVRGDPAQVLFTVADLDKLQVVAEVYQRDLGYVHVGQVATATVEAWPGQSFPAPIATIGDVADPITQTIKVRAWLNNENRKLKPDMFARLHILTEHTVPRIVIPQQAVIKTGGRNLAYVQSQPGRYEPREVTVEKVDGDHVRVLNGLALGERIVLKPAAFHDDSKNSSSSKSPQPEALLARPKSVLPHLIS